MTLRQFRRSCWSVGDDGTQPALVGHSFGRTDSCESLWITHRELRPARIKYRAIARHFIMSRIANPARPVRIKISHVYSTRKLAISIQDLAVPVGRGDVYGAPKIINDLQNIPSAFFLLGSPVALADNAIAGALPVSFFVQTSQF